MGAIDAAPPGDGEPATAQAARLAALRRTAWPIKSTPTPRPATRPCNCTPIGTPSSGSYTLRTCR